MVLLCITSKRAIGVTLVVRCRRWSRGLPRRVMGQALACEYLVQQKGQLKPGCQPLPEALDDKIAALQLAALGVKYDEPTAEQIAYAKNWQEGM